MQVHRDYTQLPPLRRPVVTIGSFDGVHLGHRSLLADITRRARELDGESVVVTFDPHPRSIVADGAGAVQLLTTTAEKIERLSEVGIDHLVIVGFTREFALQSPEAYLHDFLLGRFQPHTVVIGYDHRFGAKRSGDIALLRRVAEEFGTEVCEISAREEEDIAVSSTRIRRAIEAGDMLLASQLLGGPYPLTGRVVHGEAIGRTIGFPTANLDLESTEKMLPADGVYACRVRNLKGDEIHTKAMLYIGERPSLSGRRPRSIEVNVLDFDGDLYGQLLRVDVIERVRPDQAFASLAELRTQILLDRERIHQLLLSV